jgi:hypothetical protein
MGTVPPAAFMQITNVSVEVGFRYLQRWTIRLMLAYHHSHVNLGEPNTALLTLARCLRLLLPD